jgi:ABC-type Fe3+ transport system permease subunit
MGGGVTRQIVRYVPTVLLALLLLGPLLVLFVLWLTGSDDLSLLAFIDISTLLLVGKSMLLSSTVALMASFMGTICGFLLYRLKFPLRGFYKLLLLLPLLVPPYIFAVAWKDGFQWLFGNSSAMYSEVGMIIVHTLVYFPLAMLITGTALSQIHSGLEEAGLMRVSFTRMLIKIVLPLIRPALTISFLLILIISLSDFSVPAFFGVKTFTTEIFTQFSAFYNHQLAISQSFLLVLLCLMLLLSENRYLSEAPFFSVHVKGSNTKHYSVRRGNIMLHIVLLILLAVVLVLPVVLLFHQALSGREIFFSRAWELLSPTIFPSAKLAFLGALLISSISLWVAYMKERSRFPHLNTMLLLTFIIPSTVLGVAVIKFYNQPATNFIYTTIIILLITYVGRFGFIAARIIGNGIKQIPGSLEEVARVIGIPPVKRFFSITIPLLLPSLFTAFVLSFVLCLGELGTTIMIYPPGTELMPVKIFTIGANAPLALTSSMILISFGVTLFFILLFFIVGKILFNRFRYV